MALYVPLPDTPATVSVTPNMATILTRGYARIPALASRFTKTFVSEGLVPSQEWGSVGAKTTWLTPPTAQAGGYVRSTDTVDVIVRGEVAGPLAPPLITLDEVAPFWFAFGFRVPTPVAGNINVFGFGMPQAAPPGVFVGFDGSGSTVKFSGYTYNGSVVNRTNSTINADGGIHYAEGYCTGPAGGGSGAYFLAVDNETPVSMGHANLFPGSQLATADWVYAGSVANPVDIFWAAAIWPIAYTV